MFNECIARQRRRHCHKDDGRSISSLSTSLFAILFQVYALTSQQRTRRRNRMMSDCFFL
jgi:hypothetical protein